MSFFEAEFPRAISYKAVGGASWNTTVIDVSSGAEQRNRNWAAVRGRWTISLLTPSSASDRQAFVDALETFFLMIGGRADPFRFYNHLSFYASNQAVADAGSGNIQLQRVYALADRSYTRTITKPITSDVIDYQGNSLTDTVVLKTSGGSTRDPASYSVDETTGIVSGTVDATDKASFQYHLPVRLDTDDFQIQVEDSDTSMSKPIVSWNSLTLVEVKPPDY